MKKIYKLLITLIIMVSIGTNLYYFISTGWVNLKSSLQQEGANDAVAQIVNGIKSNGTFVFGNVQCLPYQTPTK